MVISRITQSVRKVYAYAGIPFVPSFHYTLNEISTEFINTFFKNVKTFSVNRNKYILFLFIFTS